MAVNVLALDLFVLNHVHITIGSPYTKLGEIWAGGVEWAQARGAFDRPCQSSRSIHLDCVSLSLP